MQFDPTHESRLHSARERGEREERFLSGVRRTSEGDDLVEQGQVRQLPACSARRIFARQDFGFRWLSHRTINHLRFRGRRR